MTQEPAPNHIKAMDERNTQRGREAAAKSMAERGRLPRQDDLEDKDGVLRTGGAGGGLIS